VLAAGFIGYFGRYLAMLIIERIHRRKSQEALSAELTKGAVISQGPSPEAIQLEIEKQKAKLEKKKAKAEVKRAKKEMKG